MNYLRIMQTCVTTLLLAVVWHVALYAHCEVPCGIYNDELRIVQIKEHVTTIEKAMKQIIELSKAGDKNYNQLVRWITTKDEHAGKIQHIVSQYFMTQRIKSPKNDSEKESYLNKLSLLHEMLIAAMKTKQTTDTAHCTRLRELTNSFGQVYFTPAEWQHLKEHHGE